VIPLRQGFGGLGAHAQNGVALPVIAVALAAVGALALIAAALQPMRAERAGRERLLRTFDGLEAAVVEFAMVHKRLPCPADLAAATGLEAGPPGACADLTPGAVPWRTLGVAAMLARDPWGRPISYHVAVPLTADRALLAPAAGAGGEAAALTSHGPDRAADGEVARVLSQAALLDRAGLAGRQDAAP